MKLVSRRAASLLLAVSLLLASAQSVWADDTESAAPAKDAALSAPPRTPDGYRSQPFETGYLLSNGAQQSARRSHPRRYDLIRAGRMPDASFDQGGWNTAWAAGVIRSAESSLYTNGAYAADPLLESGLSARHLAYFAYASGANPDDPADRTGADAYLLPQGSEGQSAGRFLASGNLFMAAATLARWSGAAYADILPYPEAWMFDREGLLYAEYQGYAALPGQFRFDRPYQLSEARILPRYDAQGMPDGWAVKETMLDGLAPVLLLSYDPQLLGAAVDSGMAYYRSEESEAPPDHLLTLVGWNDDIPAAAFAAGDGQLPAGPGGWLARNCWGGEQEFIWISYYSEGLSDTFAFALEPARYDHNYQYDGLGATALMQATGSVSMANLFTATGEETLDSVGFYTADHGAEVNIQVYTSFTDSGNPTTGIARLGQGQSERFPYAGYHTVALDRPVSLAKGETFAVVITLSGSRQHRLFVERSVEGYAAASVQPGQSLLRAGGVWTDLALSGEGGSSLCIKAFTTDRNPIPSGQDEKKEAAPSPAGMGSLLPFDGAAAAALAPAAFEEAVRRAKEEGQTKAFAPVALVNYTDLLPEGCETLLRIAGEVSERIGIEIVPHILADTVEDGRVLGRIYLDPAACAAPLRLGALPADPSIQAVFDGHFANPVRVIRLTHQGAFGAPVGVALAADLVGLLPDRLLIYRYNPETNRYRLAEDVEYLVDDRGYLRLLLSDGGAYVITDRALAPKA